MSALDDMKYEPREEKPQPRRSSISVGSLDELSEDMGDIYKGRFLALLAGVNPTDEDATGAFMSALGETFGDLNVRIGVVQNGVFQAGLTDLGYIAFLGGNGLIDALGININALVYAYIQTMTAGGVTRIGRVGSWLQGDDTQPSFGLRFTDEGSSELVVNGTFDTDLSNWIEGGSASGSFGCASGRARYLCNPPTGGTDTLTSDRIVVSDTNRYNYHAEMEVASGFPGRTINSVLSMKWYDNTSGGSLLRTDTLGTITSNISLVSTGVFVPPAGALSCEFVLSVLNNTSFEYGTPFYYLDNVSMKAVTIDSGIGLTPAGDVFLRGGEGVGAIRFKSTKKSAFGHTQDGTTANSYATCRQSILVHMPIKIAQIVADIYTADDYYITIEDYELANVLYTSDTVTVAGTSAGTFTFANAILPAGRYWVRITPTTARRWRQDTSGDLLFTELDTVGNSYYHTTSSSTRIPIRFILHDWELIGN